MRTESASFEGVCVNYRNPDPRRGEPRVGSAQNVAFPVDPVDPVDPLDPAQNSTRLIFIGKRKVFSTFCGNWLKNLRKNSVFCFEP